MWNINIDLSLLKKINLGRNTTMDPFFNLITDSAAWVAFGFPVILFLWCLITKNKSLRSKLFYVLVSVLTSAIISTVVKNIVAKPRPFITYPFIQKVTDGGSYSFPSGHTCDAFSFATAISLIFPKWVLILPAYVWAFGVGYSRIDLGVHYPSDVLGGMVIGTGAALLCFVIKKNRESKNTSKHIGDATPV